MRRYHDLKGFHRPGIEVGLPVQIARVGFRSPETYREPEERPVMLARDRFKWIG